MWDIGIERRVQCGELIVTLLDCVAILRAGIAYLIQQPVRSESEDVAKRAYKIMGPVKQYRATVGQATGKRPVALLHGCLEAPHDEAKGRVIEFQLKKIDEFRGFAFLPLPQ